MNVKQLARRGLAAVAIATSLGAAGHVRADSVFPPEPPRSGTVLATAAIPTAPRSPSATPASTAVRLTWRAPSSNGGTAINRYRVQRARRVTGPWRTIAKPNVRRYRASGLRNGVRYYFRVAAHNTAGWSRATKVVSAVPRTVPTQPLSLTATPGAGGVTLKWLAPSNNGGAPIDRYAVQWSTTGTSGWTTHAQPTTTTYTTSVFSCCQKYYLRILAHNATGWSPASSVVAPVPRTVPSAPRSLTTQPGLDEVTLTWLAPSQAGGSPIDKYAVQWSTTGTSGWKTYAQPTTTTYTTSVFSCCQKYFLRILAHNATGWSPASNVIGYLPAAPSEPLYLSAAPGNQSVYLKWDAPANQGGASVQHYEVQWATSPGGPWTTNALEPSTSRVVYGLTNGTPYYFQVRAYNAGGFGPYTPFTVATPSIVPSAPLNVKSAVAGTTVTLTWSAPTYDGGSPVQQYNVYATLDPNGPWTHIGSTGGPALKYIVNDAAPGKTTHFRIAAENQNGEGAPASVGAAVPPTVPGKPTVCTTTLPGGWQSQIIRVTWDPPISDGGKPILFYEVQLRVMNSPNVKTTTYVWSPTTTVDLDRLNDSYNEVFITPYNHVGAGLPCYVGYT
jgi:titin